MITYKSFCCFPIIDRSKFYSNVVQELGRLLVICVVESLYHMFYQQTQILHPSSLSVFLKKTLSSWVFNTLLLKGNFWGVNNFEVVPICNVRINSMLFFFFLTDFYILSGSFCIWIHLLESRHISKIGGICKWTGLFSSTG